MGERWTVDQVLMLAPDAASVRAGQKLATPTPWTATGHRLGAVWGLCAGSGRTPYRTVVDLTAPAYKCSCPSRKFPCKHAIGLLLLWSEGSVPEATEPPDDAAEWLAGRATRTVTPKASAPPKDPAQAAKTAAQRADRVRAGVEELQLWLTDQVVNGLAGAEADAYRRFDTVAARLVDAQAPGLARRVRRLPELIVTGNGADWPDRLLAEFGRLWSLTVAHQRLDQLPEPLQHTVRRHVGYQTSRADVLATPGVTDTWAFVGSRTTEEDRLQARRTYVFGVESGRFGLILDYAPTGAVLPTYPVIGSALRTAMHFYPGNPELRCLPDEQPATLVEVPSLPFATVADARRRLADAVAADPWLSVHPVLIGGRLARTATGRAALVDDAGAAVELLDVDARWAMLLALSGGQRIGVVGDFGVHGLDPFAIQLDGQVVGL